MYIRGSFSTQDSVYISIQGAASPPGQCVYKYIRGGFSTRTVCIVWYAIYVACVVGCVQVFSVVLSSVSGYVSETLYKSEFWL